MSTPVCIANAVADALGADDIVLPLVPARLAELVRGAEQVRPAGRAAIEPPATKEGRRLRGEGMASIKTAPERVWEMLLDPETLRAIIPGCDSVEKISDTHFRADVNIGIGPVTGRYRADVTLSDLHPPHSVTLGGSAVGALGFGSGAGRITLVADGDGGTVMTYDYDASIGGKVASIGGRLLDGATKVIIGQFFAALARHAGGRRDSSSAAPSLFSQILRLFGGRR